jgi:tRNA1(Val) A37 N6-methylase TrmN6
VESSVLREGETLDGLFRNKVRVIQARRGYRVSEDAVFLAWFTRPRAGEIILDVGAGAGAIAFGLAVKAPLARVVGLEIQQALADRAGRGVCLNGLEDSVAIIRGDFRTADQLFRPRSFDVVVSNPPYHEAGKGRMSMHPGNLVPDFCEAPESQRTNLRDLSRFRHGANGRIHETNWI